SRNAKWKAGNDKAPHILEIDLQKYYIVTGITLHSGLLDEEKRDGETTQAAGFWSVKNFRFQYWDDANWTDLPGTQVLENRLTTAEFILNPPVTTFKIRLVADDGEAISVMELEIFGKEAPNMPAPPVETPAL